MICAIRSAISKYFSAKHLLRERHLFMWNTAKRSSDQPKKIVFRAVVVITKIKR